MWKRKKSSRIFRADGRLVNMSEDFCKNNAQAPTDHQLRATACYVGEEGGSPCIVCAKISRKERKAQKIAKIKPEEKCFVSFPFS